MVALKPSPPSAQPFGPCPALREVSSLTLPCGCDLGQTSILTADPWTRDGPPCLSVVPEGCLPLAHDLPPLPGPLPSGPQHADLGLCPPPFTPSWGAHLLGSLSRPGALRLVSPYMRGEKAAPACRARGLQPQAGTWPRGLSGGTWGRRGRDRMRHAWFCSGSPVVQGSRPWRPAESSGFLGPCWPRRDTSLFRL